MQCRHAFRRGVAPERETGVTAVSAVAPAQGDAGGSASALGVPPLPASQSWKPCDRSQVAKDAASARHKSLRSNQRGGIAPPLPSCPPACYIHTDFANRGATEARHWERANKPERARQTQERPATPNRPPKAPHSPNTSRRHHTSSQRRGAMQRASPQSPPSPAGAAAAGASICGGASTGDARQPIVVRPCASFDDCAAVAALCGQEFWEECRGQGLSVQKWVEIEAEELQRRPSWWRQIGGCACWMLGTLRADHAHCCILVARWTYQALQTRVPPCGAAQPPPNRCRRHRIPYACRPGSRGRAPAGRGGADAGERGGRLHQLERVQPARRLRPHHPGESRGGHTGVRAELHGRGAATPAATSPPGSSCQPTASQLSPQPRPISPCCTTECWMSP